MGNDKKIEVKKGKSEDSTMEEKQRSRELSIRRGNPFSLFQEMDHYFNELSKNFFDDWFWPLGWPRLKPLRLKITKDEPFFRTPLANITEDEKNYKIEAEMPGLEKADIKIMLHEGNLEIKAESKEEKKEEKEGELIRREYRSSSYYRAFNLPENINEDAIEANFEKGILSILIPKKEPEKVEKKKIEIQ